MNPFKALFSLLLLPLRIIDADSRDVDEAYNAILQNRKKYTADYRRRILGRETADGLDAFILSSAEHTSEEPEPPQPDYDEYENGRDLSADIYYSDPKGAEEGLRRLREKLILEEAFSPYLVRLLREKHIDHVAAYKKAGIDRKLFSKIISKPEYVPSKKTVLALAIGMGLDINETRTFLEKAGYTLSKSILTDVVVAYFISRGVHDMDVIARALACYESDLKSLAELEGLDG